ncbi:DUF2497 domain-containing protein [Sphingomonas corticis]|jgi:hypothetical protein|uniref:DUF2497 domain-containing protein n=1 Tax=Sphingomonas corticis TaxID=2722791 RepID=A0ABX1CG87_9SPHN|nr:DUF2497 domain-containing protein [Sphingomonas corticis]NJR77039.1 DUF2497 domain-containing protein [Sphingomonas corticis]
MGDMSAEPSMEDILASIKRVIKEGETQGPPRRMSPRPAPAAPVDDDAGLRTDREEILELRQPLAPAEAPSPAAERAAPVAAPPFDHAPPAPASPAPSPPPSAAAAPAAPLAAGVSSATAEATRDALGALSRLVVRPEPGTDGTLEGLVRDMLRPMLSDWLDAHLPGLVEDMVAREIARITNRG